MERVVVFGRGGAGKSTLALDLSRVTGLSVVELDKQFGSTNLDHLPPGEWAGVQEQLAAGQQWILDGDLGPFDAPAPDCAGPTRSSFSTCRCSGARGGRRGVLGKTRDSGGGC